MNCVRTLFVDCTLCFKPRAPDKMYETNETSPACLLITILARREFTSIQFNSFIVTTRFREPRVSKSIATMTVGTVWLTADTQNTLPFLFKPGSAFHASTGRLATLIESSRQHWRLPITCGEQHSRFDNMEIMCRRKRDLFDSKLLVFQWKSSHLNK